MLFLVSGSSVNELSNTLCTHNSIGGLIFSLWFSGTFLRKSSKHSTLHQNLWPGLSRCCDRLQNVLARTGDTFLTKYSIFLTIEWYSPCMIYPTLFCRHVTGIPGVVAISRYLSKSALNSSNILRTVSCMIHPRKHPISYPYVYQTPICFLVFTLP